MKIVRFTTDGKDRYGILKGNTVREIEGKPFRHIKTIDHSHQLSDVKLLAPCTPTKLIAMGLNYHEHAKELGMAVPSSPLTFLKPSTAVVGHEESIIYPSSSARVDYEGELAVVIKKSAWRVAIEDVQDYILGYTSFNDFTARETSAAFYDCRLPAGF